MPEAKDTTLLFLIKRSGSEVSEVCLALKKRGFGEGRWNGVGGKVQEGETMDQAIRRETKEETSVDVKEISKIAEIVFHFPNNISWNMWAYFCENWNGEPTESEEMNPKWYSVSEIPYQSMWPDDEFWLPQALTGKLIKAEFTFDKDEKLLAQEVKIVEQF